VRFPGKQYRIDEQMRSAASGKTGHRREFILCHEPVNPIALKEAERCELTGKHVRAGILEVCAVTGKHVLPAELELCAASGKRALKRYLVPSSVSQARILENNAIRRRRGKYCAPAEARNLWLCDHKYHPRGHAHVRSYSDFN